MLEILEGVGGIIEVLISWGLVIGIVIAAGVTYIVSLYLWDEFHLGVFAALCVPFCLIGIYIQYKIKWLNHKNNK